MESHLKVSVIKSHQDLENLSKYRPRQVEALIEVDIVPPLTPIHVRCRYRSITLVLNNISHYVRLGSEQQIQECSSILFAVPRCRRRPIFAEPQIVGGIWYTPLFGIFWTIFRACAYDGSAQEKKAKRVKLQLGGIYCLHSSRVKWSG